MKFNVTRLDKVLLIQTLYLHAEPKGYGQHQYHELLRQGKAVEGLSREECDSILSGAEKDLGYLVDYYNGKPLKLGFKKMQDGRVLVDSIP